MVVFKVYQNDYMAEFSQLSVLGRDAAGAYEQEQII